MEKAETLSHVSEITKNTNFEGLGSHEVVTLAAIAENLESPDDRVSAYAIKSDMEASGFTKIAATIALKELLQKGFISQTSIEESYNNTMIAYTLTDDGWNWVLNNKEKFTLQQTPQQRQMPDEDDIPF